MQIKVQKIPVENIKDKIIILELSGQDATEQHTIDSLLESFKYFSDNVAIVPDGYASSLLCRDDADEILITDSESYDDCAEVVRRYMSDISSDCIHIFEISLDLDQYYDDLLKLIISFNKYKINKLIAVMPIEIYCVDHFSNFNQIIRMKELLNQMIKQLDNSMIVIKVC